MKSVSGLSSKRLQIGLHRRTPNSMREISENSIQIVSNESVYKKRVTDTDSITSISLQTFKVNAQLLIYRGF